MSQLTPEQIANWKLAIPELESFADSEIQALRDAAQAEVDARQECDTLVDGLRCGILRKDHAEKDHGFMAPA